MRHTLLHKKVTTSTSTQTDEVAEGVDPELAKDSASKHEEHASDRSAIELEVRQSSEKAGHLDGQTIDSASTPGEVCQDEPNDGEASTVVHSADQVKVLHKEKGETQRSKENINSQQKQVSFNRKARIIISIGFLLNSTFTSVQMRPYTAKTMSNK